jgi:hypothetical protein
MTHEPLTQSRQFDRTLRDRSHDGNTLAFSLAIDAGLYIPLQTRVLLGACCLDVFNLQGELDEANRR